MSSSTVAISSTKHTRAMFRKDILVLNFVQIGSRNREHVSAVIIGHTRGPPRCFWTFCRRGRLGCQQAMVCDRLKFNNSTGRGLRSCVRAGRRSGGLDGRYFRRSASSGELGRGGSDLSTDEGHLRLCQKRLGRYPGQRHRSWLLRVGYQTLPRGGSLEELCVRNAEHDVFALSLQYIICLA